MEGRFAEAAKRYARLGLCVIPLQPKGKVPVFSNWPEIATKDESVITRWWIQNPDYNVGIATGKKSGIFVVDVDPANGGTDSYDEMISKHGLFPDTWQQVTGSKGMHLFFRYPAFPIRNAAGIFPGIDIRGDGGQVVAPPSIHPKTGLAYEWDGLDDIEHSKMAEAPLWLLDLLQAKDTHQSQHLPVAAKIQHGVQHYTLLALAGMMRRLGLNENEITPSLQAVNRGRCEQPGSDENVRQIAQSVMRYRPADADLFRTSNKLWRMTKAKEIEEQQRSAKLGVAVVDGLSVYRSAGLDNRFVISGILHNGLTMFAGRPKVGKSWLVLQLALSVATGDKFLAKLDVHMPGGVVYVALEEGQNRTAARMKKLVVQESPYLQNLLMVYAMDPLFAGGTDQLSKLLEDRKPNLVIIDTFLAFVGGPGQKRDVMRSEYREIDTIGKIAAKYETAIVLVHHMRKSVMGESGIDSVAGSTGVTAATDAVWTIKREDQRLCSLDVVGREVEEQSMAIRFKQAPDVGWELLGMGSQVKEMKDEREIMILLRAEGNLSATRVASLLKLQANRVRGMLQDMEARGMVHRNTSGTYYASKLDPPFATFDREATI